MRPLQQNFLMSALEFQNSNDLQAVRSALVLDVLRRRDVLFQGETRSLRLRVHGESMLPALWPGDMVEIAPCSSDQVRAGDIVLAHRDGRLFLHRLRSQRSSSGLMLCGDSMPGPDAMFPADALLGRMVSREGRPSTTSIFRARLMAKLSRAVGFVLCHWSLARRVSLRVHRRCQASLQPMPDFQNSTELSTS